MEIQISIESTEEDWSYGNIAKDKLILTKHPDGVKLYLQKSENYIILDICELEKALEKISSL